LAGRLVAPYLQKYIPGSPAVVVQNVPGAGSLTLANQLYNTAAKDGTVIGLVTNGMPTAPLLTPDSARFDVSKFTWVGSNAPEAQIVVVWHTAPVKTVADLFTTEIIVGATTPGVAIYDMPVVTNALLGTKFKIVSGYEGSAQIDLATERGEVQGQAALGWISAKTRNMAAIRDGQLRIIAQYGLKKHPDLLEIPLFDLPKNDIDRQALLLMFARQEYGRPLVLPPGVPADRVAAIRAAFMMSMKDQDFRADAQKAGLEVNPVSGEELDALTRDVLKSNPESVKRLRALLDPDQSQK
jgi:tripartite-type tricarboxylate transporter receptor subunit TctC